MVGWDCINVTIPDGEVGALACFYTADLVLHEHLAGGPGGVAAQSGLGVNGFVHTEGVKTESPFGGLAAHGSPETVTGRNGSYGVV